MVAARIESLTIEARRLDLPRPWGHDVPSVHLLVADVANSDGTAGTGFAWTPTIGASAAQALLDHEIRDFVVGGPTHPEVVWDNLWWHLHEGGGGGITTIAMAAVDIALWDARAKAAGVSLVDLLGRRRDAVRVYGSGVNLHYPLEELREQAHRWVAGGYAGVKMKVGKPDLDEDVERVAAVREIIGPRRLLMIDANQRWDLPAAMRAINSLERFDLHWVEEPLLADDVAAYGRLRAAVRPPIALGENVYTVYGFRDFLLAGACDIAQPNVVRVGGITPFFRIAVLAATFAVPVAPHLLLDLSGQLALCLPRTTMVEDVEDASFAALGAVSPTGGVRVEDGRFRADTPPGHGLDFTTAATGHTTL